MKVSLELVANEFEYEAYLEPITFLLRVCRKEAARESMPWDYIGTAAVTVDDRHVATVKGFVMSTPYNSSARDATVRAVSRIGAVEMIWSRKKNGVFVPITIPVPGSGRTFYI